MLGGFIRALNGGSRIHSGVPLGSFVRAFVVVGFMRIRWDHSGANRWSLGLFGFVRARPGVVGFVRALHGFVGIIRAGPGVVRFIQVPSVHSGAPMGSFG